MLQLERVTVDAGGEQLTDVTLAAPCGAVTGAVTQSVPGRIALEHVVVGINRPQAGVVLLDGEPVDRAARAGVGYLTGEVRPPVRSRVLDELVFLARMHGMSRGEARASALEALATLGLSGLEQAPCTELSPADHRLVQLAGALVHAPSVLVVGEPFLGLDRGRGALAVAALRETASAGAAVLALSTAADGLDSLCDDLVVLHHRGVALPSARAELDRRNGERYRITLESGDLGWLRSAPGVRVVRFGPLDATFDVAEEADAQRVLAEAVRQAPVCSFVHEGRRLTDTVRTGPIPVGGRAPHHRERRGA